MCSLSRSKLCKSKVPNNEKVGIGVGRWQVGLYLSTMSERASERAPHTRHEARGTSLSHRRSSRGRCLFAMHVFQRRCNGAYVTLNVLCPILDVSQLLLTHVHTRIHWCGCSQPMSVEHASARARP